MFLLEEKVKGVNLIPSLYQIAICTCISSFDVSYLFILFAGLVRHNQWDLRAKTGLKGEQTPKL